ncbi:hypothetical protein F7R91_35085 [Streptomyces luteolifulvus]|uniref:Uncharacterized protein n=1 Tax=Streptomyces luteolifulvus TaxID=2615112 RepID=A0A6H9UQ40_9ACTN|nr:hypothetical protein [Streptomyces luteolifulvus]KAB1140679.1 hypothetical protein F7R91_35085 [Streptomyces luteolifulvus]
MAVVASLVTTLLSLRAQRENTRDTLDTQKRLFAAQERALHERSHAQDLRDKRAEPYLALIKWADQLLEALDELDEVAKPYLSVEEWNISPDVDNLLDLLRPTSSTCGTRRSAASSSGSSPQTARGFHSW